MYIFLSYKIDLATPMYGGKKGFSSKTLSSIEKGDSANTQEWTLFNHLGTHVDVPYHFYQNGQKLDDFSADLWVFQGESIQVLEADLQKNDFLIKPENIKSKKIDYDVEFVIIKTGFGRYRSQEKYWKYNPGVSIELSDWIANKFKNIKILGLDSISVSSWQHRDIGRKVHKKMLNPKNPTLFIEDMDLSKVNTDTIFNRIHIAPLMVGKSDGAPCTILAEVENG